MSLTMASPLAIAQKPLGCATFAGGQLKPIEHDFALFYQALLGTVQLAVTDTIETVAETEAIIITSDEAVVDTKAADEPAIAECTLVSEDTPALVIAESPLGLEHVATLDDPISPAEVTTSQDETLSCTDDVVAAVENIAPVESILASGLDLTESIPIITTDDATDLLVEEADHAEPIVASELPTTTGTEEPAWTIAAIGIPIANAIPIAHRITESLIEQAVATQVTEDAEVTEESPVASQDVISVEHTVAEASDSAEWTIAAIGIPTINAMPTTNGIPEIQGADIAVSEEIPQVGPVEDDQVSSEATCTQDIPTVEATHEVIEVHAMAADDEPASGTEDLIAVEERTVLETSTIPATESVANEWTIAAIGIPIINAISTNDDITQLAVADTDCTEDVAQAVSLEDEQVPIEIACTEDISSINVSHETGAALVVSEQVQPTEEPAQAEEESDEGMISQDTAPVVESTPEQEAEGVPTPVTVYPVIFEDDFDAAISSVFNADFERLMDLDVAWSVPQVVEKGKSQREITRERLANKSTAQFSPQNLRLEKAAKALSIDGAPPVQVTRAPARAVEMAADMSRSHSRKSSSSSVNSDFSTEGAFDSAPCPGTPVTEYNMTPTKNEGYQQAVDADRKASGSARNDADIPADATVTGDEQETTE